MSNWGQIRSPESKLDPAAKWCIGTERKPGIYHFWSQGSMHTVPVTESTPEFERSIRLRLSDLTLQDMIYVNQNGASILARTLKTHMGFTFVWEHYNQIEAWKEDICYFTPVSDKFNRFMGQVEEYAAVYLHPSTNLDYDKLPTINTLNEKLSFHKNVIHRGEHCCCEAL